MSCECLGDIEDCLPGLKSANYKITSNETTLYNCIAWALGEDHRWWSPSPVSEDFWPSELPKGDTVDVVRAAFLLCGFEDCESAEPEHGFDKVAFYAAGATFKHVAKQLPSGRWSSKLGSDCDIEHDLTDLIRLESPYPGYQYGEIAGFMRRPRQ